MVVFQCNAKKIRINDFTERGIVHCSLRHFVITQRIITGLSYRQFADMFGTSIEMMEKPCWYLNDEMRKKVSIFSYLKREDKMIDVT